MEGKDSQVGEASHNEFKYRYYSWSNSSHCRWRLHLSRWVRQRQHEMGPAANKMGQSVEYLQLQQHHIPTRLIRVSALTYIDSPITPSISTTLPSVTDCQFHSFARGSFHHTLLPVPSPSPASTSGSAPSTLSTTMGNSPSHSKAGSKHAAA